MDAVIVTLVGPITYWWSNWDTDEHREFVAHRELVSSLVEKRGHLVYRPFEAFKGTWAGHEHAQQANDAAISISDWVIDLTPRGIQSNGTSKELDLCEQKEIPFIWLPPGLTTPILTILEEVGL